MAPFVSVAALHREQVSVAIFDFQTFVENGLKSLKSKPRRRLRTDPRLDRALLTPALVKTEEATDTLHGTAVVYF